MHIPNDVSSFVPMPQLVDVILIATQVLGPADGSAYIIDFFGPRVERVDSDAGTYLVPQEYGRQ